jgi:UDP-N-acetylglucosamine 2-epimerase
MNVTTIIGARPQFVKAAPISRTLRETGHSEFLVHTGQHYDESMSAVFFRELDIPEPDINLEIGSGSHGRQTGRMLIGIEDVLLNQKPDWVLIYGDTNSTVAGALAAVKLHIPVAHVEAGLRSFNRTMPEEHNRVVTDHLSKLLFCPTQTAMNNLVREVLESRGRLVGDVMYDSVQYNIKLAEQRSCILEQVKLSPHQYALATVHRAENTDHILRLTAIFQALEQIGQDCFPVVLPLHPRTRKQIHDLGIAYKHIHIIEPVPYLDMLVLEKHAHIILTDSGGVQKEAYWFQVPCITLRDETEWVETVKTGWNVIVGTEHERILREVHHIKRPAEHPQLYGDGQTASKCVSLLDKSVN